MAQTKPVHEVRLGKVKAAVWRNESDNDPRFGVTFARIYKTEQGWESSTSFGRDELPLVAKVADIHSMLEIRHMTMLEKCFAL